MAVLSNSWDSLRSWWQAATPPTRAAAAGMALLLLIGLVVAVSLSASPDYQAIYHGVAGKEANKIESVLHDHGILMRYSDKDGTISVPSKDESNATMYVEASGILSKDADIAGIESLDKIGLGTSSDVERERILAANEGELERKLMRLDPVNTAAVTISPGNTSSLFSSDVSPSASVILGLKQGSTLDANQVKGIVYLVAHAVSGLSPQNVTLLDQTGASLWKDNGAGGNAMGDGQPMDEDGKYSEVVRRKVQGLLDEALGPRKAIVTVNAELDFDQTQTDSLEHMPSAGQRTGLPSSVDEKAESYAGAGLPPTGGIAGSGTNLSTPSYGSNGPGAGAYKSSDTHTVYQNDVRHTVSQKTPGQVKQIAVAALVDSSVPADSLTKIKDVIATAIGAAPGDTTRFVSVQQITFDTSAQKARTTQIQTQQSQEMWSNIAKALAVCTIAGVILFGLMRSTRPREPKLALAGTGENIGLLEQVPGDRDLETRLEERPLRVEDLLSDMPEPTARRPKRTRSAIQSIEEQQDLKLESIEDMINSSPEAVALLLKGWMIEESHV